MAFERLPVVSNLTDTTPEKLIKTGYGGIGTGNGLYNERSSGQDYNDFTVSRLSFSGCEANNINSPVGPGPSSTSQCLIINSNQQQKSFISQIAVSNLNVMSYRFGNALNNVWAPWAMVWTNLNLTKATGATVIAGTNDTSFVTPKSLKDAGVTDLVASQFGVGQSLVDVTANRAINTTFWNTGAKPITVYIYPANQNGVSRDLLLDGESIVTKAPASTYDAPQTMMLIVPPGSSYRFNTNGTFVYWKEA